MARRAAGGAPCANTDDACGDDDGDRVEPAEQRNGQALVQPEERDIRAPAPEVPRCVVVLGREFEVNRRHHLGCLAAPVDDPTERALGGVVGERGVRPARDDTGHLYSPVQADEVDEVHNPDGAFVVVPSVSL